MSRLSDLIRQAKQENPELGAEIEKEVRHLQQRRSFGLNFERHVPESVELYGRPVRKGDKVRMLPPRGETKSPDTRLWIVKGAKKVDGRRIAELRGRRNGETAEYPMDDLVVVAEHQDTIYPGLVSTGKVERGGDKPFHTVINAENLHALKTLLYTHRGKVDCIYIDPPYNTGSDGWIYNDKYVAADDLFKHSKWLAFIERRLLIAKELLSKTGIIIVAIGDDEHHRLRMVMDQTLGSDNFLANIVWQGNVKNDSRFSGGGLDYMLIYGRSKESLLQRDMRWLETKPDVHLVFEAAQQAWLDSHEDPILASRALKRWWSSVPKGSPVLASKHYSHVDNVRTGEPYFASPLISPNYRPNLVYDLRHPSTGGSFQTPKNGWRYSAESMSELISTGCVHFGKDESTLPLKKVYLRDVSMQVPTPTFRTDRRAGGSHLNELIGTNSFPFPKNTEVVAKWIDMVTCHKKDAIILDFFGGSGTTTESICRLNEEDGGSRCSILITNNEVSSRDARILRKEGQRPGAPEWEDKGVCRQVTEPRLKTAVHGVRSDGSKFSDGLTANLEFFELTYEAPLNVAANHAFARISPLLWLRAGSLGRRIESLDDGWDVADAYGVISALDRMGDFLDALAEHPDARIAYVVTDDERQFTAVCATLPDHVEPVRLYESYLRNFKIDAARSSR